MTALAGSVNALYPQARTAAGRSGHAGCHGHARAAHARTAAGRGGQARTRQGWTR